MSAAPSTTMAFTATAVPLSFIDLPSVFCRGEDERARWNVTAGDRVEMIGT
jgi:hypothetical protein